MDPRFTEMLAPFLKHLGGRELTEDSRLHELGLDSMKSIELLFAIEDTFGLSLPDKDLNDTTFATAGSLWRAVESARRDTGASDAA
ncbi:phosphopantetheine-binding protein [Streptomyces sp. JW3]|uniref:phosphopantetheine-binding protein n=1 Tax=Streptomyces sp. JW3 TaxID=3456955 RepID=UPI003FA436CD